MPTKIESEVYVLSEMLRRKISQQLGEELGTGFLMIDETDSILDSIRQEFRISLPRLLADYLECNCSRLRGKLVPKEITELVLAMLGENQMATIKTTWSD